METSELAAFGELLKAFRKRKRISQQELADRLGVHRNTIGTWERGAFLPDSRGMVMELANQLGLNGQETRQLLEASLIALSSYWYLPHQRNPFFSGREEILQRLHALLSPQGSASSVRCYALYGLGGVGKTQTAIEYAYRHSQQDYSAVFWIGAEAGNAAAASFTAIAEVLKLAGQAHSGAASSVTHWLNTHSDWLLIIDNVEDVGLLKDVLPAARRGSILLTTRLQALGGVAQGIELLPLPLEESTRFLLRRARYSDDIQVALEGSAASGYLAARAIAEVMGGLPLALDQAGAYIEETQCGLAGFRTLLDAQPASLLDIRDEYADHPASVAKTFLLSFDAIRQTSPAAADLLTVCAFLAADAIPEALLTRGAKYAGPLLQPLLADPLRFNALLRPLLAFSLIRRSAETGTLSLHRLVQMLLKERLPQERQQVWAERVISMIEQQFPRDYSAGDYWQRCEQLSPHALAVLAQAKTISSSGASLLAKVALYLFSWGRHDEAEQFWLRALQAYEQGEETDQPGLITCLDGLATLYASQGKHTVAEDLFRRADALREQTGDADHPYLAYSLQGLATIYRDQGRYEEAERLLQRTLDMREQVGGPDHPAVGMALNELAILYVAQGRYEEAECAFQRAIQIWELAAPDHPYLAHCLGNLARLYSKQGRYVEADPLFRRELRMYEQVRRGKHPYQGH